MTGLRYFVGGVAFGFAAVWIMATLAAALVCLAAAAAGYGVIVVAERTRAKRVARASSPGLSATSGVALPLGTQEAEDLPRWASALNSDLGHIYEPTATTSPLARDVEYGWPLDDETSATSETLH
ncbi:MAG TPA: hypothetical protein VE985_10045 [Gaiellaceae bacterium]|nr:hypothetical protein [Gaiellaceae bacterium]